MNVAKKAALLQRKQKAKLYRPRGGEFGIGPGEKIVPHKHLMLERKRPSTRENLKNWDAI